MIDWNKNTTYFSTMRRVVMIIIAGLFWGCPEKTIDPVEIIPLEENSFTYFQDDEKLAFSIKAESRFEGNPLNLVWVDWYGPNNAETPDSIYLFDDGSHGDIISDDDIWMRKIDNAISTELTYTILSTDTGTVFMSFNAQYGDSIESVLDSISLLGNIKPYIIGIDAPSILVRPATGSDTLVIKCAVSDSNGIGDIRWVGFRSYSVELDSFMAGGLYIYLFDDGGNNPDLTSGDLIENDGIFTNSIQFPSTATVGNFDWIFRAQDHQLEFSDMITHRIIIQ